MEVIKGYKVFNPDWTAKHDDFQYEVGEEYEMDGAIIPCKRGFHFCEKLAACFNYYNFSPHLKVAEVEGTGRIKRDEDKICCSHIHIVKEIPIDEVLKLVNTGKGNLGLGNQGDHNRGDHNRGDHNRGHWNQGNCNQGNWNRGNHNQGDYNRGNHNRGHWNQGNYNQGNYNQGNYNQGDGNQGNYNQGGNNRGDYNQGNHNIGIGNKSDYIVGLWCTQEQPFCLFNKLSTISFREFVQTENYRLLMRLTRAENPQLEWETFTPEEKQITLSTENITPEILKDRFGIDIQNP